MTFSTANLVRYKDKSIWAFCDDIKSVFVKFMQWFIYFWPKHLGLVTDDKYMGQPSW